MSSQKGLVSLALHRRIAHQSLHIVTKDCWLKTHLLSLLSGMRRALPRWETLFLGSALSLDVFCQIQLLSVLLLARLVGESQTIHVRILQLFSQEIPSENTCNCLL